MAQTLIALPALTSPIVPANRTAIMANVSALDDLGRADLFAVLILGMLHSTYPTPNYRSNHPQMIQDAAVLWGGTSNIDMNGTSKTALTLIAAIAWWAGYSNDPYAIANPLGLSNDVNAILLEGRDLRTLPEETLARIMFLLFYSF